MCIGLDAWLRGPKGPAYCKLAAAKPVLAGVLCRKRRNSATGNMCNRTSRPLKRLSDVAKKCSMLLRIARLQARAAIATERVDACTGAVGGKDSGILSHGLRKNWGTYVTVLCPGSKLPAAVDVDGQLAIEACSRGSNAQDCNLGCLPQLWFSTEELDNFLAKQESCRMCGSALTSEDWYASRLAAASVDRATENDCHRRLITNENNKVLRSSCSQLRTATRVLR